MRLISILWTILNLVEASPSEFVDPNCPDYDLSLICISKCEDELSQCISACGSSDCFMECNRVAFACGDSCPCHIDCIDGCQGCENPICFCNEKCPLGCPCDNYDCDLPEKRAILALYSDSSKPAVLIQPNGGLTENFEFKINDNTEVYGSCSATLNGEVYVFGGENTSYNRRKQVSKIVGCELKRVGDLGYEFQYGACGTYNFPGERILVCFSHAKKSRCESYDGDFFHNQASSKDGHYFTTLAKINEAPLAVGGSSPTTNKAEILDISSNTWTEIDEYPYHDCISAYGTVTTSQGALIIGGYDDSLLRYVATVACYNSVGWSKLDDLQSVRGYHRAIINGDKVYVVGGANTKYTEIWSMDKGSKTIKLADSKLNGYYHYPELVTVDVSFCVKP